MAKFTTKLLNILTLGWLKRKAKKEALKQETTKNTELTLNTMDLPDVQLVVNSLGGLDNIENISSTISTITFTLKNIDVINISELKKVATRGVVKSTNRITLMIGDCSNGLKTEILKMKSGK